MITRRLSFSIIIAVLLCIPTIAQRRIKTPTGPRAVAVLEWTPKGLRLLPISLMLDGKYFDATLYRANPVPMALDQGNVYEVQHAGDVIGDFTLMLAEQYPNGAWLGQGKWLSEEERKKQEEAKAKASVKPAKPVEEEDAGPPKLRRGGEKKPEATPAAAPAPSPQPAAKPAPPQAEPPPLQETSGDANRPVLRRGKPGEEQATKLGNEKIPMKVPEKPPAGLAKVQVAVSDATNTETRPYAWKWANADEEKKIRASIEKLALEAVRSYAAKTNGPTPGALADVEIHAFDLEYNNSADVILSARVLPSSSTPAKRVGAKQTAPSPAAPAGFEYYVTIVAREDIYTGLGKTLTAVTDSKHLDAFPRMQLIDAVDADGNGGGDLLFRRITDAGSAFVLYRASGSRLDEVLSVPEPKLD
jgi:hypothetical protein